MFGLVQWQGADIFLFLKVHMILDFFLIITNDYEICLWFSNVDALEIGIVKMR
jgi:hypothetical protein